MINGVFLLPSSTKLIAILINLSRDFDEHQKQENTSIQIHSFFPAITKPLLYLSAISPKKNNTGFEANLYSFSAESTAP